ncbi:MAG: trypsin-like serine protease [Ruminococcaceae bacterium]|nr:trypsin-like serine protease [Oscillospiraceae bacterium]
MDNFNNQNSENNRFDSENAQTGSNIDGEYSFSGHQLNYNMNTTSQRNHAPHNPYLASSKITPPDPRQTYYSPYSSTAGMPAKKNRNTGRRVSALIILLCFVVSVAGGYLGSLLAPAKTSETKPPTVFYQPAEKPENTDIPSKNSTVATIASIKNSVVEVTTEEMATGIFLNQYVTTGAGSGVILSEDGYIVTCTHVVAGATNVNIVLSDGTKHSAEVIGSDSRSDIAVLKIEKNGLTPAVIGDSDKLVVGEDAIVIGNPLGELGGTVTTGIVSALQREVQVENQTMTLIQTNAAVNPGNSGGGMFNSDGELIGIINAKSYGESIEGLGFAIPSNDMKIIVDELMTSGYVTGRPALGIMAIEVNSYESAAELGVERFGVYVHEITPGRGAEKAGLEVGDYIVSINDKAVFTLNDISNILQDYKIGDIVTIQVIREGTTYNYELELTELR